MSTKKMMKSTLIKDLYGEIERLKAGKLLCHFVDDKVRITQILRFLATMPYW